MTEVREQIRGVLEHIVFANADNGYTVGRLRAKEGAEPITVVGTLPGVQCGETIVADGAWKQDKVHGPQFAITAFKTELPGSLFGLQRYLGSGLVPGIGPKMAEQIVERFGTETFRVIEEDSKQLTEVEGIGKKRAEAIKEAWVAQKAERELHIFLQTYSVPAHVVKKLLQAYGPNARLTLTTDPYAAAREVRGIGFATADKMARNLGWADDHPARLDAGVLYVLDEGAGAGHTALVPQVLAEKAGALLHVPVEQVAARLEVMVEKHDLVTTATDAVQPPRTARTEGELARHLLRLRAGPSGLPPIKVDAAIPWAQDKAGFTFAPAQAEAVAHALENKVALLTGGPGTGKTTILRAVVEILQAKRVRVALAAPTGRAAQRLSQSAQRPASTLHRLLAWDAAKGGFTHDDKHPLPARFVIVDEASMLDTSLAAAVVKALRDDAHLLLVGDAEQLPSVGPGNVLHDLIQSGLFPVTKLDQIYRQSGDSGIVELAHRISAGNRTPPRIAARAKLLDPACDVQFLALERPELVPEALAYLLQTWLPRHFPQGSPREACQVLAPMHRGPAGLAAINAHLQETLNPHGKPLGASGFRVGDKILQTRNNYDLGVFNGDFGVVSDGGGTAVVVQFEQRRVELEAEHLRDLTLAYAISVHKSQGSEFPVVLFPLVKGHFVLLQRNLLYTGLTRGRQKVIFLGEAEAYRMAVERTDGQTRTTGLPGQLAAMVGAAERGDTP